MDPESVYSVGRSDRTIDQVFSRIRKSSIKLAVAYEEVENSKGVARKSCSVEGEITSYFVVNNSCKCRRSCEWDLPRRPPVIDLFAA